MEEVQFILRPSDEFSWRKFLDALSLALQARRGRSIDPSLIPVLGASEPEPLSAGVPGASIPPSEDSPQKMDPALDTQMRAAIGQGASKNEYELLKGHRPRSLQERAKMDVLKDQFEDSSPAKSNPNPEPAE